MTIDLEKLEKLPLRGKVSVTAALMDSENPGQGYVDHDLARQHHKIWAKKKAKNAKAKHRKKFNR